MRCSDHSQSLSPVLFPSSLDSLPCYSLLRHLLAPQPKDDNPFGDFTVTDSNPSPLPASVPGLTSAIIVPPHRGRLGTTTIVDHAEFQATLPRDAGLL